MCVFYFLGSSNFNNNNNNKNSCLKLYGMKQIDRNFFDTRNKIQIEEYNLELINGFATSIASYENRLLLCAEIMNKILHKRTVHDIMNENFQREGPDRFREKCMADLIGKVVMTKYNDKTYKVNDINWDVSPRDSFLGSNNEEITFMDYYKKQYQINIRDNQQPMLSILPSAKDKRRGQTKPMLLVPELCIVTGVNEQMRTDFRFKKAVEARSKSGPADRCGRLSNFVNAFNS
jgi:aubergine-like protein